MAMQATHIRFALELEKQLEIVNRAEYLSGVMYPDSRYMCGINRNLTHDPNLKITDALFGTDFEKGWKVHVLYDMLQRNYIYDVFGIPHEHKMLGYSDLWFKVSSAKYIEDLYSFGELSKSGFQFESVVLTQNPNNEDPSLMAKWYDLQHSIYCNDAICFESYAPILDWFEECRSGAKAKIVNLVGELLKDSQVITNIYAMYPKVMNDFYEGLGITK